MGGMKAWLPAKTTRPLTFRRARARARSPQVPSIPRHPGPQTSAGQNARTARAAELNRYARRVEAVGRTIRQFGPEFRDFVNSLLAQIPMAQGADAYSE